jgi:hypothetical protein
MTRACRCWKTTRTAADHTEYQQRHNTYHRMIRHAKAAKWKEYLAQAEGLDVWAAFRYTNPRHVQLMWNLRAISAGQEQICSTFAVKVDAFQVLFPKLPPSPPAFSAQYHLELPWPTFSPAETHQAIFTSSPSKAPGLDGITFACLHQAYLAIPTHFDCLYAPLGTAGYYPQSWQQATIVVIPKPNKPDYSNPKAYQPIALLNCLGKILEKLMAT